MYSLCVCYASITEMNSTDRLSTSIVDKKTDTVQIGTGSTRMYASRYCMHECHGMRRAIYSIATWDYVSQKNACVKFDQPYLSEKVTRSF